MIRARKPQLVNVRTAPDAASRTPGDNTERRSERLKGRCFDEHASPVRSFVHPQSVRSSLRLDHMKVVRRRDIERA